MSATIHAPLSAAVNGGLDGTPMDAGPVDPAHSQRPVDSTRVDARAAIADAGGKPAYVFRINPLSAGTVLSVLIVGLIGAGAIGGLLPGQLSRDGAVSEIDVKAASRTAVQTLAAAGLPVNGLNSGCVNCGTVESIRTVQVRRGAGNEIDRNVNPRLVYRLTIRMEDGSYRAVSQSTTPAFAVGDKVRVVDAALFPPRS